MSLVKTINVSSKEHTVLWWVNRRDAQRLAVLLLALAKGHWPPKCAHCPITVDLARATLDIHHLHKGDGPAQRKRFGWKYYGVLCVWFLRDILNLSPDDTGAKYHEHFELLCRDCHRAEHGKCD